MGNIINWFEIPVADFARAVRFYEAVFQTVLRREDMANMRMAVFPYSEPNPGGALVEFEHYKPSADGTIVYLQALGLGVMLERVNAAGGKCIFGPQVLPDDIGTIALFLDSEGNRVGLHEPPSRG